MSYLRYMCLFGSSLPPVVSKRAHALFTLFVFVWFEPNKHTVVNKT